jgi:hypothetical protein
MRRALTALVRLLASPFRSVQERSLYEELTRRLRGDRGLADRLIGLERQRMPAAGRIEWLREAIRRLERDRR